MNKEEKQITGFLLMLGSTFVDNKKLQANLFVDGLKMLAHPEGTTVVYPFPKVKVKPNDKDIEDIGYEEVKE